MRKILCIIIVSSFCLVGCWHKTKPIFVESKVYILQKEPSNQYKIIQSSDPTKPLNEEIIRAPSKIIGLTRLKFKKLKDKILELKAENERLKNQE